MWSLKFWRETVERAIRTAAQALLALWGTQVTGVLEVDWTQAASVTALAALSSVLMSLLATGVGDHESSAFIDERK
jgi:hypothetical protein